jgi:DNA-binding response OmpR family regulator
LETTLRIADLSLNIKTYEIKRGSIPIQLSRKEFVLLEYLMRHKNKILTKQQIIDHVWSYESDILPNTIEVYVGYLRNKIDKPFEKSPELIHTVRGFGYKIGEL